MQFKKLSICSGSPFSLVFLSGFLVLPLLSLGFGVCRSVRGKNPLTIRDTHQVIFGLKGSLFFLFGSDNIFKRASIYRSPKGRDSSRHPRFAQVTPSLCSAESRPFGLRQGGALLGVIRPRERKIKGEYYLNQVNRSVYMMGFDEVISYDETPTYSIQPMNQETN